MVDRSGRRSAEQQNVLLVEHDSSVATPHRRMLEARGYHVIMTSDVDLALRLARQAPPYAIFLTVAPEGSDRTPFLQALRRDDHTRHIPVTFLPGVHDNSNERFGLNLVGRDLW